MTNPTEGLEFDTNAEENFKNATITADSTIAKTNGDMNNVTREATDVSSVDSEADSDDDDDDTDEDNDNVKIVIDIVNKPGVGGGQTAAVPGGIGTPGSFVSGGVGGVMRQRSMPGIGGVGGSTTTNLVINNSTGPTTIQKLPTTIGSALQTKGKS